MKNLRYVYQVLAFAVFLTAINCTTENSEINDGFSAADAGNQVVSPTTEQVSDSDIPNPEQVAADAQSAEADPAAPGDTIDSGNAEGVQDLANDQQAASPQLPAPSLNETDEQYNLAQENKAAQPAVDNSGAGDQLPSLEQVVAESDSPATVPSPAEKKSRKQQKARDPAPVMASDSEANPIASDSVSAEPAATPKSMKGHKAKRAKASSMGSDGQDLASGSHYVVQPGDTLGDILMLIYGTSQRWQDLASANNLQGNSPIYPGDILKYSPDQSSNEFEQRFSALKRSKVVVENADTLASIAERVMGNAAYWKLLWRWNQAIVADPHKIFKGQSLEFVPAEQLSALHTEGKGHKHAH